MKSVLCFVVIVAVVSAQMPTMRFPTFPPPPTTRPTTGTGGSGPARPTPPPTIAPTNPYSGCGSNFNPLTGGNSCGVLPACPMGVQPRFNTTSCCANCKPCSATDIAACPALTTMPTLCRGEPTFANVNGSPSKCCPTCIPQTTGTVQCSKSNFDAAPICATGVIPTANSATGCPTCRTLNGLSGSCDDSKLRACAASPPTATCPLGQAPTRDSTTCCLTCKVSEQVNFASTALGQMDCTSQSARSACSALTNPSSGALRVCSTNEVPAFNRTSCCTTCKFAANSNAGQAPATGANRCTSAQLSACANSLSACAATDMAVTSTGMCCPSCLRPETVCTSTQVTRCLSVQRSCESGEQPSYVQGECCKTCKPAPPSMPTCTPACLSTQLCQKTRASGAWVAQCVSIKVVQIKFNALDDTQRAVMQNFSSADAKNFLNELTARYCESQTQQTINACTLFKQKGSIDGEAAVTPMDDGSTVITTLASSKAILSNNVDAQGVEPIHHLFGNRLQQDSSTSEADLMVAASTDPYSASAFTTSSTDVTTAYDGQTTQAPTPKSAAASISTGVATVIVAAAALLAM